MNINVNYQPVRRNYPVGQSALFQGYGVQQSSYNAKAALYQMLGDLSKLLEMGKSQLNAQLCCCCCAEEAKPKPKPEPKKAPKPETKVVVKTVVVKEKKVKKKHVGDLDQLPAENLRNGHDESDGESGQDGDSTNAPDADNGTRN